eukprot:3478452-Rhodomonas_salina.1
MYLCVENCDQSTQCPCTRTSAHAIFAPPPTRDMGTPAAIATAALVLAGAPAVESVAAVILALAAARTVLPRY